jgi:uncharacterized protein YjiS (DUF1127 family)
MLKLIIIHFTNASGNDIHIKKNDPNGPIDHKTRRNAKMATFTTNSPFSGVTLLSRLAIVSLFGLAIAARKQRDALKKLDETALRDLGLTRAEADAESSRPIWDVPASWRS